MLSLPVTLPVLALLFVLVRVKLGTPALFRQVRPGFLFAALPGVKIDGARFIPQAVQAGAAAVLAIVPNTFC